MSKFSILRSLTVGMAAGLGAAWVMNRFQTAVSAAELAPKGRGKPATVNAANWLSESLTGAPLDRSNESAAGAAVHYAFGALIGTVYETIARSFPQVRMQFGMAYGAAVDLAADEIAVPMLGLASKTNQTSLPLHMHGLVSHLVFSAALEGSSRLIRSTIQPIATKADTG